MNDLMTVDEIAEMYRCSARHARDVLVRMKGFPAPAQGSGPKHRVWLRSAVRAFAAGRTRQNPANDQESRASA